MLVGEYIMNDTSVSSVYYLLAVHHTVVYYIEKVITGYVYISLKNVI